MPRGSQTLNNYELLSALFDQVGRGNHSSAQSSHQPDKSPSSGSFLRNSGQFVILHSETLLNNFVYIYTVFIKEL